MKTLSGFFYPCLALTALGLPRHFNSAFWAGTNSPKTNWQVSVSLIYYLTCRGWKSCWCKSNAVQDQESSACPPLLGFLFWRAICLSLRMEEYTHAYLCLCVCHCPVPSVSGHSYCLVIGAGLLQNKHPDMLTVPIRKAKFTFGHSWAFCATPVFAM